MAAHEMTRASAERLAIQVREDGILKDAQAVYREGYLGGEYWTVQAVDPNQALVVGGVRGRRTFRNGAQYAQFRARVLAARAYRANLAERLKVTGA